MGSSCGAAATSACCCRRWRPSIIGGPRHSWRRRVARPASPPTRGGNRTPRCSRSRRTSSANDRVVRAVVRRGVSRPRPAPRRGAGEGGLVIPRIVPTPIAPLTLPTQTLQPRHVTPEVLASTLPGPGRDKLADGAVLAVTTGQQPGLFTGPLYTVYKALSAIALAQRLERALGAPVVPVFWVAGDDHDFAEANHAAFLNAQGDLADIVLRERPADAPLVPLARERCGAEIRAALERLAREAPERLSPNVLLRPVIEAALLPTLAYAAGPAELKYLADAAPLYELLGVARQAPVPRWSGLIVEGRVEKLMQRYGLGLEALDGKPGELEARLVRESLPPEAVESFDALRQELEARYARLTRVVTAVDPTLERTVQSARNAALAGTQEIERKLVASVKRESETLVRQIARARAAVYPRGEPQERVLTLASFLIRYGPDLLDALAHEVARWAGAS